MEVQTMLKLGNIIIAKEETLEMLAEAQRDHDEADLCKLNKIANTIICIPLAIAAMNILKKL